MWWNLSKDNVECDTDVKDISKLNKVIGFENSDLLFVPAHFFYLQIADLCLFSPQAYHQLYGGSSELDVDKVVMHLKQQHDMSVRHDIKIPTDHHHSNLPIIIITACTKKELDMIGPQF